MPLSLHRLARLRTVPQDLFAKLDFLIAKFDFLSSVLRSTEASTSELRENLKGFDKALSRLDEQRELIRQVAELQDDLVRREIADRKMSSRMADLETLTTRRVQAVTDSLSGKFANDFAETRALVREVLDRVKREGEMTKAQAMVLPSWLADEDAGTRVRAALRFLAPSAIVGVERIRLGRPYDGGYVLLDDFPDVGAALSMGINDDVSWDREIADRGVPVYQYDHTISSLPGQHPLFNFHPIRIADVDGPDCLSLSSAISQRVGDGQARIILKIDIEGDEWAALDAVDPLLLAHCSQILCEFHHLERLADPAFGARAERVFSKLGNHFSVCHIHGNNCGNMAIVGNVPVPESLEVTFANRERYMAEETNELFPTALDMPNQEGRADFFLGAFRF